MRHVLATAWAIVGILWLVALSWPVPQAHTNEAQFELQPRDRPVLDTRPEVWEARMHGSEYPKEYVDYSAWWVRLD